MILLVLRKGPALLGLEPGGEVDNLIVLLHGSDMVTPESYPPFARGVILSPGEARRRQPNNVDVPQLSLSDLDVGELLRACREYGLFRLSGHGVPAALEGRMFGLSRQLLGLPFHVKEAQLDGPLGYLWGSPAGKVKVREVNWVEGLSVSAGRVGPEGPSGPAQFLDAVREYTAHMARITRALFDAMAGELGLGAAHKASYLAESDGTLRVYRYPRCPPESAAAAIGMAAHTDSSVLSVVNQDGVGGLQILRGGEWFDVAPVPGTLVVNVGDMLEAISGGEMRSVEHRVLAAAGSERMSLCYFAFPEEGQVISSARGGCKYRPFSYREFRAQVQADLCATGVKVGLKRFEA